MKKENVTAYYQALCKDLKIEPVKLQFCRVGKGGACIVHDTKGKISSIQIDLQRCADIEYALLHETAHQLLILKNNNYTHNATFKKLEGKLIDTYMYSKLTNILIGKTIFK